MSSQHMYIVRTFLIVVGLSLIVFYIAVKIYKANQVIPEDLLPEEEGGITSPYPPGSAKEPYYIPFILYTLK